jgi:hypothetical protein
VHQFRKNNLEDADGQGVPAGIDEEIGANQTDLINGFQGSIIDKLIRAFAEFTGGYLHSLGL